jgi:aldehyde:ferredoxin oxidoreductase
MHVKGLEIPGYDPRRLPAMALGFAVGTRGADHNRSGAYEIDFSADEFSVARVVAVENRSAAMDSLILCKFLRGVFHDFAREGSALLRLVTGAEVDLDEAGGRICDLRKAFNIRAGWRREDDTLPARLLQGEMSGQKLADMIQAYYRTRGWTDDGLVPASAEEYA